MRASGQSNAVSDLERACCTNSRAGFRRLLIEVGCDGFRSSRNAPDNRRPEYDLDVRARIFKTRRHTSKEPGLRYELGSSLRSYRPCSRYIEDESTSDWIEEPARDCIIEGSRLSLPQLHAPFPCLGMFCVDHGDSTMRVVQVVFTKIETEP